MTACSNTSNLSLSDRAEIRLVSGHVIAHTELLIYIGLGLAVIGSVVNAIFIFGTIFGLRRRTLPFRLYLFLLNRTCADLFVTVAYIVAGLLYIFHVIDIRKTMVTVSVSSLFYWASTESYTILTGLKLLSIARPLYYRNTITDRKCVVALIISWGMSLTWLCCIVALMILILIGTKTADSVCSNFTLCISVAQWFWGVTVGFTYSGILLLMAGTLYYAVKIRRLRFAAAEGIGRNETANERRQSLKGLRKLAVHLVIYEIMTFLEVFVGFFVVKEVSLLIIAPDLECIFGSVEEAHFGNTVSKLTVVWKAMFITRIIIDPLLNYAMDGRLRRAIRALILRKEDTDSMTPFSSTKTSVAASVRRSRQQSERDPMI